MASDIEAEPEVMRESWDRLCQEVRHRIKEPIRRPTRRGCRAQPLGHAIDDLPAHLHLLPGFLAAFPDVQFVVATHNPFVVTSVPDSHVYLLRYQDMPDRLAVESTLLDTANNAGTANEVLRDVLGLPFTVPLWVARELDELVERYAAQPLTEEMVTALREDMREMQLENLYPETLGRLLARRDDR